MISFLKQIFTWWHRQTVGTFIYTLFKGKLVGEDQFGNKYFISSNKKKWVIYKDKIESSKIPAEWHLWIHSDKTNPPINKKIKYEWQKTHQENLTGTENAHKPDGSLSLKSKKNIQKYESWKI